MHNSSVIFEQSLLLEVWGADWTPLACLGSWR